MEYRKSSSLGLIKCSCGEEIRKGDYGYVPVIEKDGIPVFGRTLCKNCKNKKDQDGSFQPDPVARKGGDARMYRNFVDKDSYEESHEHDEAIGEIVLDCVERAPGATVKRISGFVHFIISGQSIRYGGKVVTSYELLPVLRELEREGKISIDRGRKAMRIWPVRRDDA